jgi:hypothetical protein
MMPDQINYEYDIFISYSHRDKEWVCNWLLPRLETAEFKVCIDYRDFIAGSTIPQNIERAVTRSRHTLAVLTPAWADSEWSEIESLLARHGDPAARRRRLIPLLLKPCPGQLPLRIEVLSYADFTDPGQHELQFEHLRRQLQTPEDDQPSAPRPPGQNPTHSARIGLQALIASAQSPVVLAAAGAYQSVFRSACQRIQSLGSDKLLHDFFQKLELCYNLIYQNSRRVFNDASAWDDLERDECNLEGIIDEWVIADGLATPVWMQKVTRAQQEMRDSISQKDNQLLKTATRHLAAVLSQEPSRINARMVWTVGVLNLSNLAQALTTIHSRLAALSSGHAENRRLREIESGIDAFVRLEERLKLRINHHDSLQHIDDELRRVEAQLSLDVDEVANAWEYSQPRIEQLPADDQTDWAPKLRKAGADLDAALRAKDSIKTRRAFRHLRSQVNRSFNQVDRNLLQLCEELQTIGEQLAYLLRLLQGDDANE